MGICEYSGEKLRFQLCNISRHSVGCQIRSTLKESKKSSSNKYLEYNFKKFRQYIEKYFQDGMSLSNNGSE